MQRFYFELGMLHVKDSLLLMGKVWSLDFMGYTHPPFQAKAEPSTDPSICSAETIEAIDILKYRLSQTRPGVQLLDGHVVYSGVGTYLYIYINIYGSPVIYLQGIYIYIRRNTDLKYRPTLDIAGHGIS